MIFYNISKNIPQSSNRRNVTNTLDNNHNQRSDKFKHYILFYIGIITLFLGVYFFIALTFLNDSSYLASNSGSKERIFVSDSVWVTVSFDIEQQAGLPVFNLKIPRDSALGYQFSPSPIMGEPTLPSVRGWGVREIKISVFDLQIIMKPAKYLCGSALEIVGFKKFFINPITIPTNLSQTNYKTLLS